MTHVCIDTASVMLGENMLSWSAYNTDADQRTEVERLTALLLRLRDTISANLDLADKLKATLIETLLAKSDEELGLGFLLRGGIFAEDDDA